MIPAADQSAGSAPALQRPRAVFVSDFVHVEAPFSELEAALADPSAAWLQRVARPHGDVGGLGPDLGGHPVPDERGEDSRRRPMRLPGQTGPHSDAQTTVIARIGTKSGIAAPSVAVSVGAARVYEDRVVVGMTWTPLSFGQLLPSLDADLELSDLGSGASRIALSGRYRAPLGQIGRGVDRLGLHRVAESSIRQFLLEVAEAVRES
jgi:hypothetical protein